MLSHQLVIQLGEPQGVDGLADADGAAEVLEDGVGGRYEAVAIEKNEALAFGPGGLYDAAQQDRADSPSAQFGYHPYIAAEDMLIVLADLVAGPGVGYEVGAALGDPAE